MLRHGSTMPCGLLVRYKSMCSTWRPGTVCVHTRRAQAQRWTNGVPSEVAKMVAKRTLLKDYVVERSRRTGVTSNVRS